MIKDFCTRNVQYVDPGKTLTDVAKLMNKHDCGTVLVAENDKLTGVITDRDIVLRCVAESMDPMSMTAEQCQSPGVLYCYEEDKAEDILRNMAKNKVRRLAVLDNKSDKNLVGVVSFGDLAAACKNKELTGEAMKEIRKAA